jgi:DNA-binding transcriptional MocR family regulator
LAKARSINGVQLDPIAKVLWSRIARNTLDRGDRGALKANSQKRLANDLGVSRSTIAVQLDVLHAAGLLRHTKRRRRRNEFDVSTFELLEDNLVVDDAVAMQLSADDQRRRQRWADPAVALKIAKRAEARRKKRVESDSKKRTDVGHGPSPAVERGRDLTLGVGESDRSDTDEQRHRRADTMYDDDRELAAESFSENESRKVAHGGVLARARRAARDLDRIEKAKT